MTSEPGDHDMIIVGAGIGGMSLAAELSADRRVCVMEAGPAVGAQTTGKSVATFIASYGNDVIQALNAASLPAFHALTATDGEPIAARLPFVYVADDASVAHLDEIAAAAGPHAADLTWLDGPGVTEFNPTLRPGWAAAGLVDPDVLSIDVHALMTRHVATLRAHGGRVVTFARLVSARRSAALWELTDAAGQVRRAPVVVNAAGPWADTVAGLLGVRPRRITPLRRSVFTIAIDTAGVPMTNMADERFYFKPETGRLLCSPADETPVDAETKRPDEVEIARALDAMADATILPARHVGTSWAGLRSFAADRTPVVGYGADADGVFWYAGLGGYGIQTSPALSRLGAALIDGRPIPDDIYLDPAALSPDRAATRLPATAPTGGKE